MSSYLAVLGVGLGADLGSKFHEDQTSLSKFLKGKLFFESITKKKKLNINRIKKNTAEKKMLLQNKSHVILAMFSYLAVLVVGHDAGLLGVAALGDDLPEGAALLGFSVFLGILSSVESVSLLVK